MNRAAPRFAFFFTVIVAIVSSGPGAARAQETWGQGQGSASAWQAGSSSSATTATHPVLSGSGSNWTAGKGSFESHNQQGGVWHDGAASSVSVNKSSAKNFASGHPAFNALRKPPSSGSLPAITHGASPAGRGQPSHSAVGLHQGLKGHALASHLNSSAPRHFTGRSAFPGRGNTLRKSAAPTGFSSKPEVKSKADSLQSPSLSDPFGNGEPATPDDSSH
jgi:hypothetical protein